MNTQQDIEDIFSILHDGTIESYIGNKNKLTLKISCVYLAEQINKSFEYFYVELTEIDILELFTWRSLMEEEQQILINLKDIFKFELEIIDANIEENIVIITCKLDNKHETFHGGNLKLNCKEIKVFDQNKTKLTIEKFRKNCNQYWDSFGNA